MKTRWKDAIAQEYGIELTVLDQSWVVDECLRPSNAFIVNQELGIAISATQPVAPVATVLPGPLVQVSEDRLSVLAVSASSCRGFHYIAWHPEPTPSASEIVYLSRVSKGDVTTVPVVAGADPDCFATPEGPIVSWIRRAPDTKHHTLGVSRFDSHLSILAEEVVADKVQALATRPCLSQWRGEPCLVFLSAKTAHQCTLHTRLLASGRTISCDLPFGCRYELEVGGCGSELYAALLSRRGNVEVLAFAGDDWKLLSSIKCRTNPERFGFAAQGDAALVAVDSVSGGHFEVTFINTKTGGVDEPWTISAYGKFPTVVSHRGGWLMCWTGHEALPLDLQGRHSSPESRSVVEASSGALNLASHRKLEQSRILEWMDLGKDHPIDTGPDWALAWSTLWLGCLDITGKCLSTHGPLGLGTRENYWPKLGVGDQSGLLTWLSGSGEEDACILARELSLH